MNRCLSVPAWALVFTSIASANAIYSDLGPGKTFDPLSFWAFPSPAAMSFVPAISASAYEVDIALANNGGGPGQFTVDLETDSGSSSPSGTVLQTWSLTAHSFTFTAYAAESLFTSPIPLTAGKEYWLVVIPDNGASTIWNNNNQGVSGESEVNPGGGWTVQSNVGLGAFDVLTPEPSTFVCLLIGFVVLTVKLRSQAPQFSRLARRGDAPWRANLRRS